MGSTTPWAKLSVTNTGTGPSFIVEDSTSPDTTPFIVDAGGNVGIGTTSPWRKLSVTGTVGFDGLTANFGAGSLCLTANKEVVYNDASENCTSSLRATKHDINPLVVDALSQVLALQPVSFVYNEGNGRTRFGFIAEDTAAVDAHLTTYNANGALTGIDDRAILSVLVAAIKDIASIGGAFKANLIAWLADTTNGIQDLFAKNLFAENITAHRGTFDELCVKDDTGVPVCVTGIQLRSLLSGSVLGASAANDNDPPTEAEPPAEEPAVSVDATASSTPPVAADEPPTDQSSQDGSAAIPPTPDDDNEAPMTFPATEPTSAAQ